MKVGDVEEAFGRPPWREGNRFGMAKHHIVQEINGAENRIGQRVIEFIGSHVHRFLWPGHMGTECCFTALDLR